jgi:hypothetical protein
VVAVGTATPVIKEKAVVPLTISKVTVAAAVALALLKFTEFTKEAVALDVYRVVDPVVLKMVPKLLYVSGIVDPLFYDI